MVIFDADNSPDHVLAELRSHGPLVTQGCYLVVADSILGHLELRQAERSLHRRHPVFVADDMIPVQ